MYRIGYAPGTFDLFHIGHLNLLRNARKHCDVLIAGVVADEIAFRAKGVVPVIPITDRLEILRCIKFVDSAHAHVKDDILAVWQELHFETLFKGDDWQGTAKGKRLERDLATVGVELRFLPYTKAVSSTLLRQTIQTPLGSMIRSRPPNLPAPLPEIGWHAAGETEIIKRTGDTSLIQFLFDLKARIGVTLDTASGMNTLTSRQEAAMRTSTIQDRNSAPAVVEDPRWARIVARDKSADGRLWYSVSTTGVYCRPSCPSRTANPKNVQLHDSLASARATGFRPCKRCNPEGLSTDRENAAIVARACRMIEESEEEPSLSDLADAVDRSPSYFHRVFKAIAGLTPKDYAIAHRAKRVRGCLNSSNSVTGAIYDAGFNSSGRFYETSTDMLGMTPTQYMKGGVNEEIRFAVGEASLGAILVASSQKGVAAILLGDDPDELVHNLQDRFPKAKLVGADRDYEAFVARVVGFVEMPKLGLDLPLDVRGTSFQQRVWQALREIPVGRTVSYAEVARRIGAPKAVRAVAGACAKNNLAVAIPCHRVVKNDGAVSGYAWGVERKRALLKREAQSGE